ncbi:RNA binding protein [Trema orientale]|uniref:Flowering time control protein FCA n=1 Tax=Trema orientale TaxID=63057 RepID=A0A2P5F5T6_TREOI|nr:RNA binding protein [Trema orientale]
MENENEKNGLTEQQWREKALAFAAAETLVCLCWSSSSSSSICVFRVEIGVEIGVEFGELGFCSANFAKLDRHRGDRYGSSNNNNNNNNHNHDDDDPDSHSSYGARHSRGPSRFSDAPMNHHHHHHSRRSPNTFRRPFDFESPPRRSPTGGGFRPVGGGFRPVGGGGGGGFSSNYQGPPPPPHLSGQKRGFPFSGRGGSPERFDRRSFAKLFVGSVPRTSTEEDIRPLFEDHGDVVEVALIRDKKTGQQQGCCFIKYATSEEADRAIRALHNQHTLPGGVGPIQVRYADGERERLGAVEYKLFVGSLNKQATEKEVEEIFSQYGRVEDVYLMRDELKQSRGCGFVKYSQREMALAAINALNGSYTMRGCDQPLTVRFADPKRPRPGESRVPAFGGPGFGPRFQGPGPRPVPNFGDPMRDQIPPNAWHPMSPPNMGPSFNANIHGSGGQLRPRSGDMALPVTSGLVGSHGGPADSSVLAVPSSTSQQSFNQSMPQVAPVGQQMSPLQKPFQSPQQLPPPLKLHPQTPASYSQAQTSVASLQHLGQPHVSYSSSQTPLNQPLPSQLLLGSNGLQSISQPQVPQSVASGTVLQSPPNLNLTLATNPNQLPAAPAQQQLLQPFQQSPSHLAQMLSQQKQALQASFQSSQQAFSQLQQQLQLMQPSNQGLILQQSSQDIKQQQWPGTVPQAVNSLPAATASADVPSSTSAAPAVPLTNQAVAPVKCSWTEHTSPDGYKYYYNSVTGESKWEKPEELISYEQQQQRNSSVLQPNSQSLPQLQTARQVSQTQQMQLQTQFQMQVPQQLPQPSLSSTYQASGIMGHQNVQGHQHAPGWMWKNKPAGSYHFSTAILVFEALLGIQFRSLKMNKKKREFEKAHGKKCSCS